MQVGEENWVEGEELIGGGTVVRGEAENGGVERERVQGECSERVRRKWMEGKCSTGIEGGRGAKLRGGVGKQEIGTEGREREEGQSWGQEWESKQFEGEDEEGEERDGGAGLRGGKGKQEIGTEGK